MRFHIDYSLDEGSSWQKLAGDWRIERRGEEPKDFWSQSFSYGSVRLTNEVKGALVRFTNTGKRNYLRAEAHGTYRTPSSNGTKVTFHWTDDSGARTNQHTFANNAAWDLATGRNVETKWVELE